MKKSFLVVFGSLLVISAIWATTRYLPRLSSFLDGVKPVITPSPADIAGSSFNSTGLPLTLPRGFSISVFARDLPGARVMVFDEQGNLWVSQTSQGTVSKLTVQSGEVTKQEVVFRNLRNPHGLAFDPEGAGVLYIAEEHRISKSSEKIADLPTQGGGHFTRTIKFGPDQRLYVSIGSSCNVCSEADSRRAKIFSMNRDGSDFKEHARGLRNAVFFTWDGEDRLWATEMGRDLLGDDIPPDEINIIEEGKDYGWPYCYGKNIRDTKFSQDKRLRCLEPENTGSHIDLQAHSAPLGLAFLPKNWPEEYRDDLVVAFHGSWNRSEPTGYKIVRLKLDAQGNYLGSDDFISGWLTKDGALGRPVDIVVSDSGEMYVSDDKAGVIYKITRQTETAENFIRVENPKANQVIESPLCLTGEARGTWFFEASFPVRLLDAEGRELAVAVAQAKGEWMTENFVPFEATLNFKVPASPDGVLVFQKDNPSGLPEHDAAFRLPVRFH